MLSLQALALLLLTTASPAAAPNVLQYVQDYGAQAKGMGFLVDPKSPPSYPVKDLKNGYLTVTSNQIDGTIAYVLFRGKDRDLVVEEMSECGPGCSYSYVGISFKKGAFEKASALSAFYPLAEMQRKVRELLPTKLKTAKFKTWPAETDFRFILPKEGKITKVYVLTTDAGPTHEETYFDVGTLAWDKAKFAFTFRPLKVAKDLGQLDLY